MSKQLNILFLLFLTSFVEVAAQVDSCIFEIKKHEIQSENLGETREFWVSLPMNYDSSSSYPILYVLDAEWRFDLIRAIAYDLSGNRKMPHHIIVGIPHINWQNQRGIDLTFSHSSNEYDGEAVDSTVFNASNSGGGAAFFSYLEEELIPLVTQAYPSNGKNILVGHSYGGYFGSYILPKQQIFSAFQIYDPSIWFSNGECITHIEANLSKQLEANIFISYQPIPAFHSTKIEKFIATLANFPKIKLGHKQYKNETHNALFMYSFLDGMKFLYSDWKE